jgi:hypothetical protein
MRQKAIATLLWICALPLIPQTDQSKIVEPDIIGQPYQLDSANQTLKKLPQEPWKAVGKPGWGSSKGLIVVEGSQSPFRIKSDEKVEIVFSVQNAEQVRLYSATTKNKSRQTELAQVNAWRNTRNYSEGLDVTIMKYGSSSFKLTPNSKLASGEYFVDIAGKLFTFGVD